MPKKHQYIASGKKTRTGQHRKARHKAAQHLTTMQKQGIPAVPKVKKGKLKRSPVIHRCQEIEPGGYSFGPILQEAMVKGEASSKLEA